MPNSLEELLNNRNTKINEAGGTGANKEFEAQGYDPQYDAVTDLARVGGLDLKKIDISDTRNFNEGRMYLDETLSASRAQNQSTMSKIGNAALKVPVGVGLGILETAGYMLDLENYGSLLTGSKTNYDNWFSKGMRDARQGMDEALPVHQGNPEKAWNPGDVGWLANNVGGLVESIAEFFVIGLLTGGGGTAVGAAAKGGRALAMMRKAKALKNMGTLSGRTLAQAKAKVGRLGAQVNGWNKAAQAGSALDMGVALSSMNAVGTYEKMKQTAENSIDPNTGKRYTKEQAEEIALNSAATTFNTSLLFNSAMNFTSLAPFFRGKAVTPRSKFKLKANEAHDDYLARLKQMRSNPEALDNGNKFMSRWYVETAQEMGSEAVEEYGEALAGQMGENVGMEQITGKSQKLNLFSEELLTAAALGMAGGGVGMGFKKFFDRNNDTKLQESFTTELDARISGIEKFTANQKKLAKARATGDDAAANEAETDLFVNTLMESIVTDTTETYVAQMEDILKLSEEEAKEMGYNIDVGSGGVQGSGDYRSKAEAAIKLVNEGKSIARAVQQDSNIPAGLKEHLLKSQLNAAFNESIISGLHQDIHALEANSQALMGPTVATSDPYFNNLESQVDALDSMLKYYESNPTQADKRQIAHLKKIKNKVDKELNAHKAALKEQGQEYTSEARMQSDYLKRTQLYRELYSRESLAQTNREDIAKMSDPAYQDKMANYYEQIEKRPHYKGILREKVKNLIGGFYALGESGNPKTKQALVEELKTLEASGEFEALDIDPEHNTKAEILAEVMDSFMSPEDLRSFFAEDSLGTWDNQTKERIDDGSVTLFGPKLDNQGEVEGEGLAGRSATNTVTEQTTLADIYSKIKGDFNDTQQSYSLANRLEANESFGDNPLSALINALEATYNEQKAAQIEKNKAKVQAKVEELNAVERAEIAAVVRDIYKQLGIDPNKSYDQKRLKAKLDKQFENGGLEALQRQFVTQGVIGVTAWNDFVDQINQQGELVDPRYISMSIRDIFNGHPKDSKELVVEVLYLGKVGTVENVVIGNKDTFIFVPRESAMKMPEVLDSLTAMSKAGIEVLPNDMTTTNVSRIGIDVLQQEHYPMSFEKLGSDITFTIGNETFRMPPYAPDQSVVIEGGRIVSINLINSKGLEVTITDPTLAEDVGEVMLLTAMALEEYIEENRQVTVQDAAGRNITYTIESYIPSAPEQSVIKTSKGKTLGGNYKLRRKDGELTLKGKVIAQMMKGFNESVLDPLVEKRKQNEVNQQQNTQPTETQGTQETTETNTDESVDSLPNEVQQLEEQEREADLKRVEKTREYAKRYDHSIRQLIQDKDVEALKAKRKQFDRITKYKGDSLEIVAQRDAAQEVIGLIDAAIKANVTNETPEKRGDDVVLTTDPLPTSTVVPNDAPVDNEAEGATLFTNENDNKIPTSTPAVDLINDDYKINTGALTFISAEDLNSKPVGSIVAIEAGDYTHIAKKTNKGWAPIAIINNKTKASSVILANDTKNAPFIDNEGNTKKVPIATLQKGLDTAVAQISPIAYDLSRDQATTIYNKLKDRVNDDTVVDEKAKTLRENLDTVKEGSLGLTTLPGMLKRTERTTKKGGIISETVVSVDSNGEPSIAIDSQFDHITPKGVALMNDPTVSEQTHSVRFKIFPEGNSWWKSKGNKAHKGKEAEYFPIYVELVDKKTGEATVVSMLNSATEGVGLADRKAIYDKLQQGETVTAEINKRIFKARNGKYSNVLNTRDMYGNPMFFPVYDVHNGLTNTWNYTEEGPTKKDQEDKILILTTEGVSASRSIKEDGSRLVLSISGNLGNYSQAEQAYIKAQLSQYSDLDKFTEGQVFTAMLAPDGSLTIMPLSTANLSLGIVQDFLLSPLQQLTANAISDTQFEEFEQNLNQVLATTQRPKKNVDQNFFQIDRFTDNSNAAVMRYYDPALASIVEVSLTNVDNKLGSYSGLIHALQQGNPSVTAHVVEQTLDGENFKFTRKKKIELPITNIEQAVSKKKFNVSRDRANKQKAFTITNPTTNTEQTFSSYNAFLIGMPDNTNSPNALYNKQGGMGNGPSVLRHNMANVNGNVFVNAGMNFKDLKATNKAADAKAKEEAAKRAAQETKTPKAPTKASRELGETEVLDALASIPEIPLFVGGNPKKPANNTNMYKLEGNTISLMVTAIIYEGGKEVSTIKKYGQQLKEAFQDIADAGYNVLILDRMSYIHGAPVKEVITLDNEINKLGNIDAGSGALAIFGVLNQTEGKAPIGPPIAMYGMTPDLVVTKQSIDFKIPKSDLKEGNEEALVKIAAKFKRPVTFTDGSRIEPTAILANSPTTTETTETTDSTDSTFKPSDKGDAVYKAFIDANIVDGLNTFTANLPKISDFLNYLNKFDPKLDKSLESFLSRRIANQISLKGIRNVLGNLKTAGLILPQNKLAFNPLEMLDYIKKKIAASTTTSTNKGVSNFKVDGIDPEVIAAVKSLTQEQLNKIAAFGNVGDLPTKIGNFINTVNSVLDLNIVPRRPVFEDGMLKLSINGVPFEVEASIHRSGAKGSGVTMFGFDKSTILGIVQANVLIQKETGNTETIDSIKQKYLDYYKPLLSKGLTTIAQIEAGAGKIQSEWVNDAIDVNRDAGFKLALEELKANDNSIKPKVTDNVIVEDTTKIPKLQLPKLNLSGLAPTNKKKDFSIKGKEKNRIKFRKAESSKDRINTKEAKAWLEKRGIPFNEKTQIIHAVKATQGSEIVHGYFTNGLVYLSSSAQVGTEYHEAFHAVFNIWTTPKQQRQLLAEAKSKFRGPSKAELAKIKSEVSEQLGRKITNDEALDLFYEEVLAEKFREYTITNQKPRSLTKSIWKLFKDLFNYLKTFMSNRRSIDQMFSNIESGRIRKTFKRKMPSGLKLFSKQGYNSKAVSNIANAINTKFVMKYDAYAAKGKVSASNVYREIREDFLEAAAHRLIPMSNPKADNESYSSFIEVATQVDMEPKQLTLELGRILMSVQELLQNSEELSRDLIENAIAESPVSNEAINVADYLLNLTVETGQPYLIVPSYDFADAVLEDSAVFEDSINNAKAYLDVNIGWDSKISGPTQITATTKYNPAPENRFFDIPPTNRKIVYQGVVYNVEYSAVFDAATFKYKDVKFLNITLEGANVSKELEKNVIKQFNKNEEDSTNPSIGLNLAKLINKTLANDTAELVVPNVSDFSGYSELTKLMSEKNLKIGKKVYDYIKKYPDAVENTLLEIEPTSVDDLYESYLSDYEDEISSESVRKTYSGKVTKLESNQVFVFGSNPEGRHGAGAAKFARMTFGAIYGQGEGLQGQSYALPTKDLRVKENKGLRSISPNEITQSIKKLYETANSNPKKEFLVSDYSGKNLNGYTGEELAKMFIDAGPIPSNIVFNENFNDLIEIQKEPVSLQDEVSKPETVQGLLVPEDGWKEIAAKQLKSFGLTIKGSVLADDLAYDAEKVYGKDSVEDSRTDRLSGKVKNLMSRLPRYGAEPVFGIVPFVPFEEVAANVAFLMSDGIGITSASTMLNRLANKAKKDPTYKTLYDELLKLAKSNELKDHMLFNDFYKNMALTYRNFHIFQERAVTTYDPKMGTSTPTGEVEIINYDANSQRLTNILLKRWKENSKRPNGIFTVSEEGNTVTKPSKLNQLKSAWDTISTINGNDAEIKIKHAKALVTAFNILGIELDLATLKKGLDGGMKVQGTDIKGAELYRYLTRDLQATYKGSGRGLAKVIERLNKNDSNVYEFEGNFFKKGAAFIAQYSDATNMSFMNGEGKIIYPINMHSAMTRQLNAVIHYQNAKNKQSDRTEWDTWIDSLMDDPLYNYGGAMSPLLSLAINGSAFEQVSFTTLDVYKRKNENTSSNTFDKMPETAEYVYRLNAFANNSDVNSMFIPAPTLPDRKANVLVKMPRMGATKGTHKWDDNYKQMFKNMLIQDLKAMQQAEAFIGDKIKNQDTSGLIKTYHYKTDRKTGKIVPGNYTMFSQLRFLEKTAVGKELKAIFGNNSDEQFLTTMKEAGDLIKRAEQEIDNYINTQAKILQDNMKDLKVNNVLEFKDDEGEVYRTETQNAVDLTLWKGDANAFARDYIIANMIAVNDIRKMTAGETLSYKSYENYSKRYRGYMTPGLESAISGETLTEGYVLEHGDVKEYSMAIVNDVFSSEASYEFMATLKKLKLDNANKIASLIDKTYSKGNSNKTDAMGYTTIHKHRAKMLGQGIWSEAHQEAYENYNAGKEFAVFEADGTSIKARPLLQPLKTYHDGLYEYGGRQVRVLTKHSTFPLLREFTKNSPRFEALRQRMEGEGKYAGLEPIDEVNQDSAIKVGIINPNDTVNMVDKDGNPDFTDMQTLPFKLATRNQRIPQTIPTRVKASKIGSQLMKLAPAALTKFKGVDYTLESGGTIKGSEVFNKYQEVLQEMQKRKQKQMYDRLGYKKAMKPAEQVKFLKNLRQLLMGVIEERGLSSNYVKALDIVPTEDGGYSFATPFTSPAFGYKFEQMMVSLFKNGPLNLTINGKAFVQIAEFGGHATDGDLKFLHTNDGKTIEAAEIAIPHEMADKLGLPKDANGEYDLSSIDPRILTLTGYRIPTQGKSAMLPLRIKRIIPKGMGKVVLVPGEITAQMGSDFDVDKLFTMMPNYRLEYKTSDNKKFDLYDQFSKKLDREFGNALKISAGRLKDLWQNDLVIEELWNDGIVSNEIPKEELYDMLAAAKSKVANTAKIKGIDLDKDKPTAVYVPYNLSNTETTDDAGLENMFIELTNSILKNPVHLEDVLSPVDSDTAANLKEMMSGLITDDPALQEDLDPMDYRTELMLALRSKVGAAGIGYYATHMTGAAVAEHTDVYLADNKYNIKIPADNTANRPLNGVEDGNKVSTIYNFSKHLTMAVDNANDPIMGFLNDNLFTAPVTAYFIRSGVADPNFAKDLTKMYQIAKIKKTSLKGHEFGPQLLDLINSGKEDSIDLALQIATGQGIIKESVTAKQLDFDGGPVELATMVRMQPSVRALTRIYQNNDYTPAQLLQAIEETIVDMGYTEDTAKEMMKNRFDKPYTSTIIPAELLQDIGKPFNFSDKKFMDRQVDMLVNFYQFHRAGSDINTVNKTYFNADVIKNKLSNVAGLRAINDTREDLDSKQKPIIGGYRSVLVSPNAMELGEKSSYPIANSYNNTYTEMLDFMSKFFAYADDGFTGVSASVKFATGKKRLNEAQHQAINRFAITYLLSLPKSPVNYAFKPENFVPLLYKKIDGQLNTNSIVDKLNAIKDRVLNGQLEDLESNRFLNSLETHPDNHKPETNILALKFNTNGSLTAHEQDQLIDEFNEIIEHPDPAVSQLGKDLITYNIVAKGMLSGVDSFADVIPAAQMSEVNNYLNNRARTGFVEAVRKMSSQFIENNSHIPGLVTTLNKNNFTALDNTTLTLNKKYAESFGEIGPPDYFTVFTAGKKVLYKGTYQGDYTYSSLEHVHGNLTGAKVQKGVPYKLIDMSNKTELLHQHAAIREEVNERSDCNQLPF